MPVLPAKQGVLVGTTSAYWTFRTINSFKERPTMGAEAKAKELGIEFTDDAEKAYLNMVARLGNT